jgi:hypothetical protein
VIIMVTYDIDSISGGGGTSGVTSVGGLQGIVGVSTPNNTLQISSSGNSVTFDVKLNHANTWTADQTFGNILLTGKVTEYNSVSTAGVGMNAILAVGRSTAQTAAVPSVVTYTVPVASDHSYLVTSNVLITAATTCNFSVVTTYTDEANVSRSLTHVFLQTVAANAIWYITDTTGVDAYCGAPLYIRAKAGTTITMATTGTFTSVAYNVEGAISVIA